MREIPTVVPVFYVDRGDGRGLVVELDLPATREAARALVETRQAIRTEIRLAPYMTISFEAFAISPQTFGWRSATMGGCAHEPFAA